MRNRKNRAAAGSTWLLSAAMLTASLSSPCYSRATPAAPTTPSTPTSLSGKHVPAAQAPATSTAAALALFSGQVQAKGHDAQLPPNLSMELALNDGTTPVPVRQIATRVDTVVHAFNVLAGERRQRVLFRYDESTHLTVAYSMRVDGALDKAVSYHSGGASSVVPPAAAKAGYLREVKFWSEYVRGKSAAPAPVPAPPGVSPAAAPPVPTPDDAATRQ